MRQLVVDLDSLDSLPLLLTQEPTGAVFHITFLDLSRNYFWGHFSRHVLAFNTVLPSMPFNGSLGVSEYSFSFFPFALPTHLRS